VDKLIFDPKKNREVESVDNHLFSVDKLGTNSGEIESLLLFFIAIMLGRDVT
jgi:hypothetical protein